MEAQTYTATNYLFLIERRYRLIFSIYKNVCRDRNRRGFIETQFASKLYNLFELFREISALTKQFDEIFGWIFASQVVKTFMLMSFEMYFIFMVANDESIGRNRNHIIYGFLCMTFGETVKMFVNAIAIHSVYAAVKTENFHTNII